MYDEITERLKRELQCTKFLQPNPKEKGKYICPICYRSTGGSHSGSLQVHSNNTWTCYSGNHPTQYINKNGYAGGDVIELVLEINGLEKNNKNDFLKAKKICCKEAGIDFDKPTAKPQNPVPDLNAEKLEKLLEKYVQDPTEKEKIRSEYKKADNKKLQLQIIEFTVTGKKSNDNITNEEISKKMKEAHKAMNIDQIYNHFIELHGKIGKPPIATDYEGGKYDENYKSDLENYNKDVETKTSKAKESVPEVLFSNLYSDCISCYDPARDLEKNKFWDGISTGFTDLDKMLSGSIHPGVTVIAGATGAGKTTFALNLAHSLIYQNKGIIPIFISYEIPKLRLFEKSLALHNVHYYVEREGMNEKVFSLENSMLKFHTANEIEKALDKIYSVDETDNKDDKYFKNIYADYQKSIASYLIINDWNIKLNDLEKTIGLYMELKRMEFANKNLNFDELTPVVFIDYLQFMRIEGIDIKSRKDEVDRISKELVDLTKKMNLPIFLLSSVNRESYKDGKKIQLSGLKESGQIESDAEAVLILNSRRVNKDLSDTYRSEHIKGGKDYRPLEIDVLKNRHGEIGTPVNVDYFSAYDYFVQCDGSIEDNNNNGNSDEDNNNNGNSDVDNFGNLDDE